MVEYLICLQNKLSKWLLTAVFFEFDWVCEASSFEVKLQASVVILFDDSFDKSCCFDLLLLVFAKILFCFKFYAFVDGAEEDEDWEAEESDEYPDYFESLDIDF